MLDDIKLDRILFLDIETVPGVQNYDDLSPEMQTFWDKKAAFLTRDNQTPEEIYHRAGIYAEFGRIVCISVGNIREKKQNSTLRIKSFFDENEAELLTNFCKLLNESFNTNTHLLCAHNGKEFDYPYIARRCLINGIKLPKILDIAGKKPWDIKHIDTLELWKFGDYKHYTSLNLLTTIFGIPSPKDDIDGSEVANVYYKEKNLERIVKYCEKDVIATTQLFLRYKLLPLIKNEFITFVESNEE